MAVGEPSREFPTRAELRRARQAAEEERRAAEAAERLRQARTAVAPDPEAVDEFDDVAESRPEDGDLEPQGRVVPADADTAAGAPLESAIEPPAAQRQPDDDAARPPAADPVPSAPAPAGTTGPAAPAADTLGSPEARRRALRELNPALTERETFLRQGDDVDLPPEQGLRGVLARLGFDVKPSERERQQRTWRRQVGARLDRPRTISVVNGKGGANKTPTAVLLAAAFGRNLGQPVLAWDNNGTRGTLGWRTVQGGHEAHAMDLLASASELAHAPAGEQRMDGFVHYQTEDRFSVLRTDPTLLASEQHLTAKDFDVLHAAVSNYFALTVIDSGNDESAERWMRMIDHTDQLVIASTTVEEHAEAGALLLEALAQRGGHYAELARNAVVVVSQHEQRGSREQLGRIAYGFRRLARAVVTVPYDPSLVKGQIRFEALRPATRHAWLEAAAAVSSGLNGPRV
ncbi:ATPase [Zafaria sp. J156]|uniref:ATPase n=1 Tax=Zafaria sp. J156 TaxID=3116490 RepID=UPI002E78D460|nr:ATPase [Zafaria sp. J156]MEE1620619.1 ATPase [Zafaria sp. J156]